MRVTVLTHWPPGTSVSDLTGNTRDHDRSSLATSTTRSHIEDAQVFNPVTLPDFGQHHKTIPYTSLDPISSHAIYPKRCILDGLLDGLIFEDNRHAEDDSTKD